MGGEAGGEGEDEREREMVEWSEERLFVPVSARHIRRFPPLTAGAPAPHASRSLSAPPGAVRGTGSLWSQCAWNVSPYGSPPASSRGGKSAPWTLRRRSAQGSAEESAQFGRTPVGYQTSSCPIHHPSHLKEPARCSDHVFGTHTTISVPSSGNSTRGIEKAQRATLAAARVIPFPLSSPLSPTMSAAPPVSQESFKALLGKLVKTPEYFTAADLSAALECIFTPDVVQPVQIGSFLTALHIERVERRPEFLAAAANVLRKRALKAAVEGVEEDFVVDIVGTGGDGHNTFNVSTTAAIVAAGAGARVVKVCSTLNCSIFVARGVYPHTSRKNACPILIVPRGPHEHD